MREALPQRLTAFASLETPSGDGSDQDHAPVEDERRADLDEDVVDEDVVIDREKRLMAPISAA